VVQTDGLFDTHILVKQKRIFGGPIFFYSTIHCGGLQALPTVPIRKMRLIIVSSAAGCSDREVNPNNEIVAEGIEGWPLSLNLLIFRKRGQPKDLGRATEK
jgi:hypothetical protein